MYIVVSAGLFLVRKYNFHFLHRELCQGATGLYLDRTSTLFLKSMLVRALLRKKLVFEDYDRKILDPPVPPSLS